uniref:Uncharacterized protein n=1 Tax=Hyaloperonospora arabidopsidis (strain Emoy2) TaxID=559515 RepID=M4BYF7_HYAAE
MNYYCSQFDQSARSRYYSAKYSETEHMCYFLQQLNGYAWTVQIQYEKGGADSADHVEHFLLNRGEDDLMDLIYPQRLDDINRVEEIISHLLLGGKRKKQRVSTSRGSSRHTKEARDGRRHDGCGEVGRQNDLKRESRRDDRLNGRRHRRDDRRENRSDDHQRRSGWNDNRDYDYSRRVTLVTAWAEDLRAALDERRTHRNTNLYDSASDFSSDSDSDWTEEGAEVSHTR